jgi:predicted lipoprotein with Yx(FWY)xxD motif
VKLARTALTVAAALAVAAGSTASVAMAANAAAPIAPPVVTIKTSNLGPIVATKKKLGLYVWDTEKDFKVHCTAACAAKWPPVLLMKGEKVKAMVHGLMGEFGTITRPDGSTQLTWNKQPAYTYVGDTAGVVKCDNTDGWHAVRAA